MLVSKNGFLKFALPPMRNPKVSHWNKGCVGSQTQNFPIGHVHLILFCVDFIRVGSCFSVEYGLNILIPMYKYGVSY